MITVKKAASHLSLIATLQEVLGEAERSVKSFKFASRSLEDFSGSIVQAIEAAKSKELRGFNQSLIEVVEEFAATESSEVYNELVKEVGPDFLEVLQIRGIGAKKARLLRD